MARRSWPRQNSTNGQVELTGNHQRGDADDNDAHDAAKGRNVGDGKRRHKVVSGDDKKERPPPAG